MQIQTPRLSVEQLEQRLLAGTYVGFNVNKFAPDFGLPEGLGNVSELALVRNRPGYPTARAATALNVGAIAPSGSTSGSTVVVVASTSSVGTVVATPTLAAAPPVASDFFQALDSHPLFQPSGDISASPATTSTSTAPATPPSFAPFTQDVTSWIAPNSTSSMGGGGSASPSAAAPIAAPAPITSTTPTSTNSSATNQATLEAVAGQLTVATQNPGPLTDDVAQALGLSIASDHARLWLTPDRLAVARNWYYNGNEFTTSDGGNPYDAGFLYQITGNTTYAQYAVNALMNFTISDSELNSVASDTYRWNQWVPVVYDWVCNAMSPSDRSTFMDRYNYYVSTMMNKDWGGAGGGFESNNYFWGYFSNELNWSIATYYDNPMAPTFLQHAMVDRWQDFEDWASTDGVGGVPSEGSQYGPYMLAYPMLSLASVGFLGHDALQETNFFREAAYNLIYSTSPDQVNQRDTGNSYYQVFPYGDDETAGGYPSATSSYLGNFMAVIAGEFANEPLGSYVQGWLNQVQPGMDYHMIPFVDALNNGVQTTLGDLPTDYYAAGPGYFYSRDQWGPDATNIFYQLGTPTAGYHGHLDAGSFQIVRGDQYLTKSTGGYDNWFNGGYSQDTIASNSILFGGQGQIWQRDYNPQVLRLHSDTNFSYVAADISGAYIGRQTGRNDNPYAQSAVREFLYIKPWQTLITFDRLESASIAMPAPQVPKTFLLHLPQPPVQDGPNRFLEVNGDQAMRVISLSGNASYSVVDESDFDGNHDAPSSYYQYRLEETTSGQAQSYMVNVLQARGLNDPDITASIVDQGDSYMVVLQHPTLGRIEAVFQKGMTSQGGTVAWNHSGVGQMPPENIVGLSDHVQNFQVTRNGPIWGD